MNFNLFALYFGSYNEKGRLEDVLQLDGIRCKTMNRKTIALVAHDARKTDILEWARFNRETLLSFEIYATQTTGEILQDQLKLDINLLKSGPLGGDAQVATMIVEGKVDILVFFWDPLSPQPHDVDVKALLRLAVLYNIPIACNRSTADYLISSPLINTDISSVRRLGRA